MLSILYQTFLQNNNLQIFLFSNLQIFNISKIYEKEGKKNRKKNFFTLKYNIHQR